MPKATCSIEGCDKAVAGRGWCAMHYRRWRKHGDPHFVKFVRRTGTPLERATAQIEIQADGCWLWTGLVNDSGYGRFHDGKRMDAAHRFFYRQIVGPIPEGIHLHHRCHVPLCCNVLHLEPLSASEHGKRHGNKQGPCPQGHDNDWGYDPEGHRWCRECGRIKARAYYEANKVARLEYAKAYYQENREKCIQYAREQHAAKMAAKANVKP